MHSQSVPSIFQTIANAYGPRVRKLASELVRLAQLEANWTNHRVFNLRCLRSGLIRKSLVVKPPDDTMDSQKTALAASRSFLKQRIYLTNRRLNNVRNQPKTSRLNRTLQTVLSTEDFEQLTQKASEIRTTQGQKAKDRHRRKFDELLSSHYMTRDSRDSGRSRNDRDYSSVINLSDRPLSDTEQHLLEKGLNFAVSKQKLRVEEVISGVEPSLSKLPEDEAERIRSQLVGILRSQGGGIWNITPEERVAWKTLREDQRIIITKADKGNASVVLSKSDYIEKMRQHISEGPYTEVLNKRSSTLMKSSKDVVGRFLRTVKDNLGQVGWYSLYPKTNITPRLYGLPKIHKPEVPIRPIVDGIGSPPHELARYLAKLLQPVTGRTGSFVRNSIEFAQKVTTITIDPEEVLVSFDVKSLFTNVSKIGALELARHALSNDSTLQARRKMTVEQLVQGMSICLDMKYFVYDSKLYSQDQGLAMGSPLSPVLANLYMENLEQKIMEGFESPPKVWWRYVDDTFVIIRCDRVEHFLLYLNALDPAIKFSMEVESQNGQLAFLDCLVHRIGCRLKTTIYRKPTDTERTLSYGSAHPKHVYASIACSMFHRAVNLCTDEVDKVAARKEAFIRLERNGYPRKFLKGQLAKVLNPQPRVAKQWFGTAVIPYKSGTSDAIRKVLNDANVRVVFSRGQTLRSTMVHLKDPLPLDRTPNCVHKINCRDCPFDLRWTDSTRTRNYAE